jgi:hypothetical protein
MPEETCPDESLAAAKRDCEAEQHTGTERGHLIGFIVALQARGLK